MTIVLRDEEFQLGHDLFCRFVRNKEAGIPFRGFDHPYFRRAEVWYKQGIYAQAERRLQRSSWPAWHSSAEKIVDAVEEACHPRVSKTIVTTGRYGAGPLQVFTAVRQRGEEAQGELGLEFFRFFDSDGGKPFSRRFDHFADFLRAHTFPCQWALVAYVAALVDPYVYFPVRARYFQKLLHFYGNQDLRFQGYVSWERYRHVLDLGEQLKERLEPLYGWPSAVEVQSYMWIVAARLEEHDAGVQRESEDTDLPTIDWREELCNRKQIAHGRETRGLLGERFVIESEQARLRETGFLSLARRVELVSAKNQAAGYDVLSFTEEGDELHLEVKSTQQSRQLDRGFWLSENERCRAQTDPSWQLYRVWRVETQQIEGAAMGGLDALVHGGWSLDTSTWFVSPP